MFDLISMGLELKLDDRLLELETLVRWFSFNIYLLLIFLVGPCFIAFVKSNLEKLITLVPSGFDLLPSLQKIREVRSVFILPPLVNLIKLQPFSFQNLLDF